MENLPKKLASRDYGTLTFSSTSLNSIPKVRRINMKGIKKKRLISTINS